MRKEMALTWERRQLGRAGYIAGEEALLRAADHTCLLLAVPCQASQGKEGEQELSVDPDLCLLRAD